MPLVVARPYALTDYLRGQVFVLDKAARVEAGDAVDLVIQLADGYEPGDLAWVCLPASLSRIVGGGQVKLFALDFEGRDVLSIPLATTAPSIDRQGHPAPQHFAVWVRNMFSEERVGNPGLQSVTVTSDDASVMQKAKKLWRVTAP